MRRMQSLLTKLNQANNFIARPTKLRARFINKVQQKSFVELHIPSAISHIGVSTATYACAFLFFVLFTGRVTRLLKEALRDFRILQGRVRPEILMQAREGR